MTLRHISVTLVLLGCVLFHSQVSTAYAQGTAFTYQGRLNFNGAPANGSYDFRFRLASDSLGNTYVGNVYFTNAVPVLNGLFTTVMDFGPGIFNGAGYWLEVDVRTNGTGNYTGLVPLQPVTPSPYAIFANTASNLSGSLPAGQISGTIPLGRLSGVTSNQLDGITWQLATNRNGGDAATLNGLSAAGFWQLGGNSVAAGQCIGSLNNQPIEIWANGARALRLEPSPYGFGYGFVNVIGGSPGNYMPPGTVGSVIAGGGGLSAFGGEAVSNTLSGLTCFIGAGMANSIDNGLSSFLGGGSFNVMQSSAGACFIGAGQNNVIASNVQDVVIGGGYTNYVGTNANGSVIAGGDWNAIGANAYVAAIGGGDLNTIQNNAAFSVIGGGNGNQVGGAAQYAMIPGGLNNVANGWYSFAAGQQAQALHNGAFVWADSQNAPFASTAADQFSVRAAGGIRLNPGNSNVEIASGGLKVTGAGVDTATMAFIQYSSPTNIVGDTTYIYNPLCDGDPNAILLVTHNYNPPGTAVNVHNKTVGVWYNSGHWGIYNEDLSAMAANVAFNVLIIKR